MENEKKYSKQDLVDVLDKLFECLEEDYLTGHRNSGLKIGDNVKPFKTANSYEAGWSCSWDDEMTRCIGETLSIIQDNAIHGFLLNNGYTFPYFVLKKVEKQITYDEILDILKPKHIVCSFGDILELIFYFENDSYHAYSTKEKAESALARLKLENVAHYLNEDKYKDIEWTKYKYDLYNDGSEISTDNQIYTNHFNGSVCFKTEEIAKEAIKILGEETIKVALKN